MKAKILRKRGKLSIYQVLPRLFDNTNTTRKPHGTLQENGSGKMGNFTRKALLSIRDLGCTHVWYTGILEHATKTEFPGIPADHPATVKGEAGSPYAIKDYYDIAPSIATTVRLRQEEFDDLVTRTHEAGLGVIIDFVPNHLARQYHSDSRPRYTREFGAQDDITEAFSPNNNFYYIPNQTVKLDFAQTTHEPFDYYEHPAKVTGNNLFSAHPTKNDWYETVKLNYGVDYLDNHREYFDPIPDTWQKMLEVLTYWASRGVDGFRCDMAEMVPPAFWKWSIEKLKSSFPDLLFIGEVYQPSHYPTYLEAGFDYLYDKVELYEHLVGVLQGKRTARSLTNVWQARDPRVRDHMLHFMENHDEPRLASDFLVGDGRKAFPAMVVSALVNRNPVMTYFGQELGERGMEEEGFSGRDGRTTIFDYWSLESIQSWIGEKRDYKGAALTEEQATLRTKYQELLHAAITLRSFTEGQFFDLMYANPQLPDHTYAFLRACEGEVTLVVVNFGAKEERVNATLPAHLFETLHVPVNLTWEVEEILSGGKSVSTLQEESTFDLTIPAYGAVIYCFKRTSTL